MSTGRIVTEIGEERKAKILRRADKKGWTMTQVIKEIIDAFDFSRKTGRSEPVERDPRFVAGGTTEDREGPPSRVVNPIPSFPWGED